MRVALVHYHLRRGGVTRVMSVTARALRKRGVEATLVGGEAPVPEPDVPFRVEPGLAYGCDENPETLRERLVGQLGGAPDIWHIHNHTLGKNLALPRLVHHLAKRGDRLLLHLHDFAEDYRAANYRLLRKLAADPHELQAYLYPVASHIRYATLTRRDADALMQAGVPVECIQVLANPIQSAGERTHTSAGRSGVYVYPVRAIRRKNIGELLLWAAMAREGERFQITLPPTSAVDIGPYEAWKQLAGELKLPVEFESGLARSYEAILEQAGAVITTSIAEGFGLTFAEPSLAGKPLTGRNIPGVTRDLMMNGIRFGGLYDALRVPLAWLDVDAVKVRVKRALDGIYKAYESPSTPDAFERAWGAMVREDHIDAGRLDEAMQARLIAGMVKDPARAAAVRPEHLTLAVDEVAGNAAAVREQLNPSRYAEAVDAMYKQLAGAKLEPLTGARGRLLATVFMQPENLYLLRS
jgi:glycosyltransferase involved in cell wall biosynthesis